MRPKRVGTVAIQNVTADVYLIIDSWLNGSEFRLLWGDDIDVGIEANRNLINRNYHLILSEEWK